MAKKEQGNHWISLSDMMTVLMLVFLLLAILFMQQYQNVFVQYEETKNELYEDLDSTFKDNYQDWDMVLDDDLTIRFTNPEVLFGYRSAVVTSEFQSILQEFIPQYLEIITKEKYKDTISEVRIEGHTADWDNYMYTIELSQDRSNSVLDKILNNQYFSKLDVESQSRVRFWLTANGLGKGKALDENGDYVFKSGNVISANSRRVEFKIVTKSEELIEKVINNNLN